MKTKTLHSLTLATTIGVVKHLTSNILWFRTSDIVHFKVSSFSILVRYNVQEIKAGYNAYAPKLFHCREIR